MNHPGRVRVACVCALTQWALALAIQIGNYFGYLLPPGRGWGAAANLVTGIPFIQSQNILVAAVFGIVAYFAAWNVLTAWVFFAVCCIESAYLLIDQVYYKVFLDHIRLGAFERGQQFNLTITLGSFRKEVDWIFYCTAAVALLGAAWLARAILSKSFRVPKLRYIVSVAGILFLIGLPTWSSRAYGHVNENAIAGLAHQLTEPSLVSSLGGRGAGGHLIASYRSDQPDDDDPRLAALLPSNSAPRPNVVLIVLESVGSVNLLGADGLPISQNTPNLAILARHGIVFNSIYTTFPGTTRSLISLHTGGRQPTYGDMSELGSHYHGAMLPRAVSDLGYDSAYFSSERMDGEGTNIFLKQTGFGKYYDFSMDVHAHDPRYQIHSWGALEEYTMGLMGDWISGQHAGKPFLLEYMTTATHHPYGAPPGYPAPFPAGVRNADYLNALHYSDRAIGTLADFLQKRGLLQNTIIAVTGDHGEAFGDRHGNDFLHKNFTYDENIREFLLIYDGRLASQKPVDTPVTSSRVGTSGDIMATLLAVIGAPAPDVPGRNLLAEHFESRPVFFHKLASPETWGLRDGRWKYIGEIRTSTAELYDLSADPTERHNLASMQPQKVAMYRNMAQEWFLSSESEFTLLEQGKDTMMDSSLNAGDTQLGARVLTVGSLHQRAFNPETVVTPQEHLTAWTKWAMDVNMAALYEWVSPSGKRLVSSPANASEFHVTTSSFPGALPMEKGMWSVRLHENDQIRLTAQFTVQ